MEVDQAAGSGQVQKVKTMRESFRSRMDNKRKRKMQKVVKMSTKNRVISKETSYNDKEDARRKHRISGKKPTTNAALNKLGQKHGNFNKSSVHGMAMTKAEKKRLMKKKARAEKLSKTDMEEDEWISASSDEEPNTEIVATDQ